MAADKGHEDLSEEARKEIFCAVLDAQDLQELTEAQSRRLIAHRFGLSESQVKQIEREGQERQWPPL